MNQSVNIENVKSVYFLGIGGIGMSALAYYFLEQGCTIAGYDLTPSIITDDLIQKGVDIHFDENIEKIPAIVDLVIYTPAVSTDHAEYRYFKENNIPIYKRSQILGEISKRMSSIAVAGTHGKTTTTALITHLLHPEKPVLAFIGGISKNLDANFIMDKHFETMVVEADEYDRSFLALHPSTAVITSVDADHLDIYGDKNFVTESFVAFSRQVSPQGTLIVHENIADLFTHPHKITYGNSEKSDYFATNIREYPNKTTFDLHCGNQVFSDVTLGISGYYNLMNALGAVAAVVEEYRMRNMILSFEKLLFKLSSFSGVKRRFDYQLYREDLIFIDDYAHHPEEISSFLTSVKKIFPDKKITGIFQPHLYSRTRDFAEEFASALDLLDHLILLDIYPAREKPIEGVTSSWLLTLIPVEKKILLSPDEIVPYLKQNKPEILVTMGAGNIDRIVPVLKNNL